MSTAGLLAKFAVLSTERLQRLGNLVIQLEQRERDEALEREAQREIHTLKGEARILGLDHTARLAHAVEELLHRANRAARVGPDAARALLDGFDLLARSIEAVARGGGAPDTAEYEARIALIDAASLEPIANAEAATAAPIARRFSVAPLPRNEAAPESGRRDARNAASSHVDAHQLAELTRVLGELRGLHGRWRETTSVMRSIDETVQRSRHTNDPLTMRAALDETRDLARRGYADARGYAFEYESLLDRLGQLAWSLRVVSVDAHLARYPRAVRDLAEALGKSVRLEVVEYGARVEKPVLELLDEVVVHLLRNAVDHGIEPAGARIAAGKEASGRIRLAVRPIGAQVELSVEDDGAGIDPQALRRAAVANRTLSPEGADATSDEEIIDLLFAPGFTTRADVSETSGRGVGLDTVRERARLLGGRVSVESTLGRGTTFRVIVPTVASVSHVMVVRAGATQIAIPAASVHSVATFDASEIGTSGSTAFVRIDGEAVPLLDLARSMGAASDEEALASDATVEAIVLQQSRGLQAYRVARLVGEREAVQLPPGRFLEGHRFVRSLSLLEDGDLALGIDPAALLGSRFQAIVTSANKTDTVRRGARVLVVDDSELTRDVIVGFLRDAGFEIQEAVNGRDALERLASWSPDVILTDLQMPVLDGFELLREVRESPRWRDLPMIVVSTLGAEADRRQAARLGADGYLLKSDLQRAPLVETVSRFVSRTRGSA